MAILTDIRAAVKLRIEGLTFTVPLLGGVLEEWTPDDSEMDFPCIILTHSNTSPTEEQTIVGTRDIGYPVRVMICDRVSQYDHSAMPDYDDWRFTIENAFANQRLPGVTQSLECTIEPDALVNPNLPQYERMVSEFVIRCKVRVPVNY